MVLDLISQAINPPPRRLWIADCGLAMVSVTVSVTPAVLIAVPKPFMVIPAVPPVIFVVAMLVIVRSRPVTSVPVVARADRIPVSLHPRVIRIGAWRPLVDDHRRRRRCIVTRNANANSYRNVRLREQRTSRQ
jgi:hypothetical protein